MAAPWAALLRAQSEVRIRFDGAVYRIEGWTASDGGWDTVLRVYTAAGADALPVLGRYSVESGVLQFQPRFPIAVASRAVFQAPGQEPVEARFASLVNRAAATTRLSQVYPSSNVLPANLLRFYLQFSGPMRRGNAWKYIRLVDPSGKALELPFLELDQELWDAESGRLTVLFDPGRIKRGVLPRDEDGMALIEGRAYTLAIDAAWPDKTGTPLIAGFEKRFRVISEVRAAIDLKKWKIEPPRSGTKQALVIDFPAPLDYALMRRLLQVHGVAGSVSVQREETQWHFTPEQPWAAGAYQIQVDTALEDVAGNRVGKAFDVDVFEPITTRIVRKIESIPFRIGA